MKHYINGNNELYGFDDDQTDLIPKGAILIPDTYSTDQFSYLTVKNNEIVFDSKSYGDDKQKHLIASYEMAAQNILESVAVTWGYSSMLAAVSYVSSTNAHYKADAEALVAWRDSYWAEVYTLESGGLPDTVEDFLALLPESPSKPVI